MADRTILTAARLREVLHYDPDTGEFHWRRSGKGRKIKVGCIQLTNTAYTPYPRLVIRVDGYLYKASRLAWLWMTDEWPKDDAHHRDDDPLNNRWLNLQDVPHGVNMRLMILRGRE